MFLRWVVGLFLVLMEFRLWNGLRWNGSVLWCWKVWGKIMFIVIIFMGKDLIINWKRLWWIYWRWFCDFIFVVVILVWWLECFVLFLWFLFVIKLELLLVWLECYLILMICFLYCIGLMRKSYWFLLIFGEIWVESNWEWLLCILGIEI